MTDLATLAATLEEEFGPNPQVIGEGDDEQDDWGDLIMRSATLLGHDEETLTDEAWSDFQDAGLASDATTMLGWLTDLAAAALIGATVTLPFWAGDAPGVEDYTFEVEKIAEPDSEGDRRVTLIRITDGEREKDSRGHFRRDGRKLAEVLADLAARA